MDLINNVISTVDNLVWGPPMILLLVSVGVLLTIRLRGLQFTQMPKAFRFMFQKNGGEGEVSSFAALCTALSATVGTGNIVGVATAITMGGPGALFWMVLMACLGIVTKYTEATLAVKYRTIDAQGHVLGGPFFYIEKGIKERFGINMKWLAVLFALFGALAGALGIGTMTQMNSIAGSVQSFFDPDKADTVLIFGVNYSWSTVLTAVIVATLTALVIIGGLKRIASVAEKIVPAMFILYTVSGLIVLISNIPNLGQAFGQIFSGAFSGTAAVGGFAGAAVSAAVEKGIARGIFSNEAGLGSAPIAAASGTVRFPAQQGLVSMLGPLFDTIIICNITGLSIVSSGAWLQGLNGVNVTSWAFEQTFSFLPGMGSFLVMICLVLFAFTTILGWNYYGSRCVEYLTHSKKAVTAYAWLWVAAVFAGPFLSIDAVWNLADVLNGLMAFPNLVALFLLSGVAVKETNVFLDYLKKHPNPEP